MTKIEKTILNGGGIDKNCITLHSLKRLKSRVGITDPKEIESLVEKAIAVGERTIDNDRNAIIIKYDGWIMLFGKNSRKLITIYRNEDLL